MTESMAWMRPLRALVAVTGAWLLLQASTSHATPVSLRFDQLSVAYGLPQESAQMMLQDRAGFVWIGTQAGLVRFDGNRVAVFKNRTDAKNTLPDNFVLSAHEEPSGQIWFGTRNGLARYEPATQSFTRFTPALAGVAGSYAQAIVAVVPETATRMILGTGAGVLRFDTQTGVSERIPVPSEIESDEVMVNAVVHDPAGRIWIGTAAGLFYLRNGVSHLFRPDRLPACSGAGDPRSVRSIGLGRNSQIFIGTDCGMYSITSNDAADASRWPQRVDLERRSPVLAVQEDRKGGLWLGTERDGLLRRDALQSSFKAYTNNRFDQYSLADNRVSSLLLDRTGTLWVGTWFGGVSRVDLASGGFERFVHIQGDSRSLADDRSRSITGDGEGGLWIGTAGGGLQHLDYNMDVVEVFRHRRTDPWSIPGDLVTSLALDTDGLLWVGTTEGLARRTRDGGFRKIPLGSLAASTVSVLYVARNGEILAGTREGVVVFGLDGSELRRFNHDSANPDSIGNNWIYAILEDRHGRFWIGTERGLDLLDPKSNRFVHFRHSEADPASINHDRVHALFEDGDGRIWVGTAGGLALVLEAEQGLVSFRSVNLDRAGTAMPVGGILQDVTGKLWVSSTSGITRIAPLSLDAHTYTARDGLIDGSYFIGSAYRTSDGRLLFGGARGVTMLRHEGISYNPVPPPVAITDIQVRNQSIFEPEAGELPTMTRGIKQISVAYDQSTIAFEFAALHFADPSRNRFAYQLAGFDADWVHVDATQHFAAYTNLDPGTYEFRVRAANKDGVWNNEVARMGLVITPPFWMTAWFRSGVALVLLALVYQAYRFRVRFLIEQRTRLTAIVAKRTLELRKEKEAVESAHGNISRLSDIGREITAELDDEAIMEKVYHHVAALMDAEVFGIGFVKATEGVIEFPYAIEHGQRYEPYTRPLSDENQLSVWCVNNRQEIVIGDLAVEYARYISCLVPAEQEDSPVGAESSPLEPHSLIYVPIFSANNLHGVLNVQSSRFNAYGSVHVDMLRTLAAYLAVALDNAQAYESLQLAQEKLVAQEKLASLGALVAGVAHELNTPLGNGLMSATTVEERTREIRATVESNVIRRSDLIRYFDDTEAAMRLTLRGLTRASDIVAGFKQLAVDRGSEIRSEFDLQNLVANTLRPMTGAAQAAGHIIEIDIPDGIRLKSYAAPLSDVLTNLAHNALTHAFGEHTGGMIRVTAHKVGQASVKIRFADDGQGIGPDHLSKIFDPFFTTRLGQGRSGLGLNITYNIVTSLLGGKIRAESALGKGTTVILELPLDPGEMAAS